MPRLDFWLRLFHHAALGLASVCLLYAEAFFLPDPLLLALYVTAGLQILAFGAEGGGWVLPARAANLLALAVAGGGAAWVAVQLNQPDSVLANLPLPAGLLPYIGPVLIGLLVVKLFRPRTPRDFWLLQGVGALQVALACVLATNPESGLLFGLLLAAYLACALGCLTLHYFWEQQKGEKAPPRAGADRLPFAYLLAPFCLRWVLATVALAAPLFLITPRFEGPVWDSAALAPGGRRPEAPAGVGFSQAIDLNRSGPVRLFDQEAFHVAVVVPAGQPVPALPTDQRWRGGVLDTYRLGRWSNTELMELGGAIGRRPPAPAPPLVPGCYGLDFTVPAGAGGCFLAEPVRTGGAPSRRTRADSLDLRRPGPLPVSSRGPALPMLVNRQHEYHYRQTPLGGDDDPDRSPAGFDLVYRGLLTRQDVPGLGEWTAKLLRRLAADPASGLTAADAAAPTDRAALPPESWERVGRALANHLAHSGEYGYTLDLKRQNAALDPVMDFLVNVKQGHCERFASALALMLRSQGVPARVVVGFKGAVDQGDGVYSVRQNQAHAWVEIVAPERPARDAPGAGRPPHAPEWVTLDPTPAGDATPPPYSLWDWWQDGQRNSEEIWGGLVVNYNADEQAGLWDGLQSPRLLAALVGAGLALSVLAAGGVLAWAALRRRRRARRPAAPSPAATHYARLLALLARKARLRPRTGQTPREFAAEARRLLRSLPAAAVFADLPDGIVDLLYRIRYGGEAPAAAEDTAVGARLEGLAAVNFSLSP